MESPRILSEGQLKYTSPRSSWISDITGCPVMSTGAAHIPPSRPLRLSLFDISPYSSHDFRIRKLFTCCLYVIIYIYTLAEVSGLAQRLSAAESSIVEDPGEFHVVDFWLGVLAGQPCTTGSPARTPRQDGPGM